MHCTRLFVSAALVLGTSMTVAANGDWLQWRGAQRDSLSRETGLLQEWPEGGPPLDWQAQGLGEGFSTVSLFNDRIYTMGDIEDASHALALDRADGKILWKTKIGRAGAPGWGGFKGPRSTPTVARDAVVVLGQYGELACLERETGTVRWRKHFVDDFGGKLPEWGFSESVVVDGDRVICTPGGSRGTLLALHLKTGERLWQSRDFTDPAHYASIVAAEIAGTKQYVQLTAKSVAGVSTEGALLWQAERAGRTAVIPTPIVHENRVYVASGYGVGSNLFAVSRSAGSFQAQQVYAERFMANQHGGVLLLGDHLYGYCDSKGWMCQDFETGKRVWAEKGQVGKGALTYADNRLYLRVENEKEGIVALIEATPEGYRERGRFVQPNLQGKKTWPHPVVAGGRLYLRDQDILLCYDIRR